MTNAKFNNTIVRFPKINDHMHPQVKELIKAVKQKGGDKKAHGIIDKHLKKHQDAQSLHLVTLLANLRHDCTNYDKVKHGILKGPRYGEGHHEFQLLLMDCFMSYIFRHFQEAIVTHKVLKEFKKQAKIELAKAKNAAYQAGIAEGKKAMAELYVMEGEDRFCDEAGEYL